MERFFKVLLVLGIVLSISSIYFLLTEAIFAIFTSTTGVLIVAFSVFEIVRLKKINPQEKKLKPIASKAKKSDNDISWTYYDVNSKKKPELEIEPEKHKAKFTFFSKLLHLFHLKRKPKMVGKSVNKDVKTETKKVGKNQDKEKLDQLKSYILESKKNNVPKQEIVKACTSSGWPIDKVEKVILRIYSKGKHKSFFSLILLIFVVLGLRSGLVLSGNFLIGYWLDSLKLISSSAYYVILGLVVVSMGIIMFDVKDRLAHKKKVYKIKSDDSVKEIKENMKTEEHVVVTTGDSLTDIDKLLDLVNEKEKLPIEEVSGIFNISKKESEEWGKILKDEGLISLYYPTVGDVELRKKKREKKEEE